jgi:hypothetical protein
LISLLVQVATKEGLAVVYSPASSEGNKFTNNGDTEARIKNNSANAIDVTLKSQKPCSRGFNHDETITVSANSERSIGNIEPAWFNNNQGQVEMTFSAVTDISVAVVQN